MFFQKAIDDMAAGGLHCVAIAYRSYTSKNVPTDPELLAQWELPEDDLVLLAIAGIRVMSTLQTPSTQIYVFVLGGEPIFRSSFPLQNLFRLYKFFLAYIYIDNEMQDLCQPRVKEEVQLCQSAGVKVFSQLRNPSHNYILCEYSSYGGS